MKEFQPTAKSLERQRRAEESAKGSLQTFLDSSYKAIRATMAYNKFLDAGGDISPQQLKKLENFILTESKGKLHWGSGVLCEIGESGEEFAEGHEGVLFGKELEEGAKAVRGYLFTVNLEKQNFELVVLDPGLSRKYFDDKDKNEKRQYVERFAKRQRGSLILIGDDTDFGMLPFSSDFTAFLKDEGEKMIIEEIVAHIDT